MDFNVQQRHIRKFIEDNTVSLYEMQMNNAHDELEIVRDYFVKAREKQLKAEHFVIWRNSMTADTEYKFPRPNGFWAKENRIDMGALDLSKCTVTDKNQVEPKTFRETMARKNKRRKQEEADSFIDRSANYENLNQFQLGAQKRKKEDQIATCKKDLQILHNKIDELMEDLDNMQMSTLTLNGATNMIFHDMGPNHTGKVQTLQQFFMKLTAIISMKSELDNHTSDLKKIKDIKGLHILHLFTPDHAFNRFPESSCPEKRTFEDSKGT
tara:strand:- start:1028 stop:1831 length:804 start_codon:yes stop_codon:yes gene_type:complete